MDWAQWAGQPMDHASVLHHACLFLKLDLITASYKDRSPLTLKGIEFTPKVFSSTLLPSFPHSDNHVTPI